MINFYIHYKYSFGFKLIFSNCFNENKIFFFYILCTLSPHIYYYRDMKLLNPVVPLLAFFNVTKTLFGLLNTHTYIYLSRSMTYTRQYKY